MGDNRSTLNLIRTINVCNDIPKTTLLTELPYTATRREHSANCKSCGAPVPANGVCEYCGTNNALETRKTKFEQLTVLY